MLIDILLQKDINTGPGFEPSTLGLKFKSINHCTTTFLEVKQNVYENNS